MANRLQKFIYYLTAETPLFFMLALVWFIKYSKWDKPILIEWKLPLVFVAIGTALWLLFNIFFSMAQKDLSVLNVKVTSFKTGDGWLVLYVTTYLFPFASFASENYIFLGLIVCLIILLAVLTFTDYVTPHPLLFIKRYHFYEIDVEGAASEYKLISRKRIRNGEKEIKKVSRVFEFLLIRKG